MKGLLTLFLVWGITLHGVSAQTPSSQPSSGRMSDDQIAQLAREALKHQSVKSNEDVLRRLKVHVFRSSKAPQREVVLYAIGMLEARQGNVLTAAEALKKLEKQWPKSEYLNEGWSVLAEEALQRRRPKEAEVRLRKAIASDLPIEEKRKAQELLLWTLAEQGRGKEAAAILNTLHPLSPQDKPTERGLVATIQALSAIDQEEQARNTLNTYRTLYPQGPYAAKAELAYAELLIRQGDFQASAFLLRKLIQDFPNGTQADEARLVLANLLTDGRISGIPVKGMSGAEKLLKEVRESKPTEAQTRQAQILELRILVGKNLWKEALDAADHWFEEHGEKEGQGEVRRLWKEAWNPWIQERLSKGYAGQMLERMKSGGFEALSVERRRGVTKLLASNGLLETLPNLLNEVSAQERLSLINLALSQTSPEAQPEGVLKLLDPRSESPSGALLRARAEAALNHWEGLRNTLPRAKPGAERIKALLRLLQRPLGQGENHQQRLKEAEGWLSRALERGEDREPLVILVADLRMQTGDHKGALALYPTQPSPAHRGWVSLMRAQAQLKLGDKNAAKATIHAARDEQNFQMERRTLAKQLGL